MLQVIPKTPCELVSNQISLSCKLRLVGLYLHATLLFVGTTTGWILGFLTMSCQWIVSAWHRNLFWSTYTPPLRISEEKEKNTQSIHSFYLSLPFFSQVTDPDIAGLSQTHWSTRYCMSDALSNLFHTRTKAESGVGVSSWSWETHIWWCLLLWGQQGQSHVILRLLQLAIFFYSAVCVIFSYRAVSRKNQLCLLSQQKIHGGA